MRLSSAPSACGGAPQRGGLYQPGVPFRVLSEQAERAIVEEALAHHGGQMAATARALGLERQSFVPKGPSFGPARRQGRRERALSFSPEACSSAGSLGRACARLRLTFCERAFATGQVQLGESSVGLG